VTESKPKRHCMVVYAGYPLGETRVQREAEALIGRGYEVDVICIRFPDEPASDAHQGVQIHREEFRFPLRLGKKGGLRRRFLNYARFFISAGTRLTRLHRQRSYDTIQVHNLPDFLVFCALIPKLKGVPIILDLHDLMPEFYAGRFGKDGSTLAGRLVRWQERVSCRFADHVITVSEHWRQALIERGVPPQKCSVVMNVADQSIFHPLERHQNDASVGTMEHDQPRQPEDSAFRMIYHGTIVARYGLDLAIRAVDLVRREIPNVHLTVLGMGRHVPELRRLIQELDLEEHVDLINDIRPAEELPKIIRAADVGIVPYRNDAFTDGLLPTKLMEYAALGMPSIASRTTAIETLFSDTMVEFFEPGDAEDLARCIRRLHENREHMAELARGSERFNQQHNWTKIGAEYATLVDRLGTR